MGLGLTPLGAELHPPQFIRLSPNVLTPGPQSVTEFGGRVFTEVVK